MGEDNPIWLILLDSNGLSTECPEGAERERSEHSLYLSGDGDHLACRKCHRTYKMQDGRAIPMWAGKENGE